MELNPDQPNPGQLNPGAATSTGPAAQHLPPPHPDSRGYYAALHILPGASQQEISRAFRAQIRQRHPDVGPSGGSGSEDARGLLAAFAVLRNPRTRADYDRAEQAAMGKAPPAPQGPQEIPVRIIRHRGPLLRVSPVRWERRP
ncbi:DnaJ domain-containing protein [Arthrobacter sp. ov118]|uniref:DnaJ domain-containing protein n=1 Tax=Arthrobacter sp. ov118 TaxID=1761747 RepID=UPI0008F41F16|nr:DnaJ domain-containing protein [Arthrobacter sp. ov118]SFT50570.1 DnaJ domain-containing protein [Arthrobacter sp. ov118]